MRLRRLRPGHDPLTAAPRRHTPDHTVPAPQSAREAMTEARKRIAGVDAQLPQGLGNQAFHAHRTSDTKR